MSERKTNSNRRANRSKNGNRRARRKSGKFRGVGPTKSTGMSALSMLQYRTPLFPVRRRINGMAYSELFTLNSTSGVPTQKFIIANGLYDPNVQTGGHQPAGFDIMMSLYNQYTVVASKITCTFSNDNTGVSLLAYVFLSPNTTVLTDQDEIMENGLVKTAVLQYKGAFGSVKHINMDCNVAKYFGRRTQNELLDDDLLAGTAAANPTEGVYFALGLVDVTRVATTAAFVQVDVSYDAIFWEPKKLATD